MISAFYYHDLYLIFVAILSVFTFLQYSKYKENRIDFGTPNGSALSIILTAIMILFIGLRPVSVAFPDMSGYMAAVDYGMFNVDEISWHSNYVFVPIMVYFSKLGVGGRVAILFLSLVYFGSAYIAMRKIFPKDTLFAMLVFLAAFSTFSSATNGMKAGCATTLFLCSLAYRKKILVSVFFLFLSLGFHHAAQLLIACYIIASLIKNVKIYYLIWCISLIVSIFHITYFQEFFGSMTDEQGAGYLLTEAGSIYSSFGGRLGFRWDFVIYGSFPLIIGYYVIFKKKVQDDTYKFFLNIYILANSIWMLCMYASYTNRIAALGWGMYSLVTIYPFLKCKVSKTQYKDVVLIGTISLVFALFMNFIYY